ncbi:UDP-N-acetylmuramoyl-L-alanyl-D-glutamate--2,6-diaminopimelate ligase [Anaerosporobacter sp.]
MKLSTLLQDLEYEVLQGSTNIEIADIITDSRKGTDRDIFVCISGAVSDGHKYVHDVIGKGIKAIVVEKTIDVDAEVTVIKVENTRIALAEMAAALFDYPATKLKSIGITGTKGKTTTTYMIKDILENAGYKTGLIGTIETIIGEEHIESINTTPDAYTLQKYLKMMVDNGCECVVMEVSSQGLKMHRVHGIVFNYAVFTNLGIDHIGKNEHDSFEEYAECKSMLFRQSDIGIVNNDDTNLDLIIKNSTCELVTYGMEKTSDLQVENPDLDASNSNMGIIFRTKGLYNFEVELNLPGMFNLYNSMAAIAVAKQFNISEEIIATTLYEFKVKGRVEVVYSNDDYRVIIDYAHNAMSLQSLLLSLRVYSPKRIVCVFGCGGNRSKLRRFEMGKVSSELADFTIVTSDNPRDEDPSDILNDIIKSVEENNGKYIGIIDRREAIKYAIDNALEGDVIVIAGKGHETYQEIAGVKFQMDDRVIVEDIVNISV